LRQCHEENLSLLGDCCYLKLSDIPGCFRYNIWDQQSNELIPAEPAT
jgi:omega-6 fatty acid desaturase (delta-12 desaturase)